MDYLKSLLCSIAFATLISTCVAQENVKNTTIAPHGGQIKQADQYYIELLFSNVDSYVYLYDKDVQPIVNDAISGKLIINQFDSTITTIELKPYLNYAFVASTSVPAYSSCTVIMNVKGKKLSANFDYMESIAYRKK